MDNYITMKDKRLELKLSVRGDGSLSRDSTRSSNRSNRSNASNNSQRLPVSEIFATDRYGAPHNRSFDILDKYRRQPNQQGYPAQSLQGLNQYQPPRYNENEVRDRRNPYIDYTQPSRPYYHTNQNSYGPDAHLSRYQTVYEDDPAGQVYGTLPRTPMYPQYRNAYPPSHYTLPARSGPRRVRISDQAIVHGYGMLPS